ncbi:hypothetical protein JIN85_15315 [Luteolibacter pohnpeiensis]|uniref:Uncharacterized protein n=1 Tax=Luteolibacter pohnpeiensis TaxID=454153 RepID=A0A934SAB8_9BACT|nr:hypothetical protein [Luteolibacter pohnpeiensis]MBK1883786.1 hypothetical protein [Luteolibacter pohnpeiensis]
MPACRSKFSPKPEKNKLFESWNWDAARSILSAKDAPKYEKYILSANK